jgi:hypothetical protein
LLEIAASATPTGGIDKNLIFDLARLVDRCFLGDGCNWDDLVRGATPTQVPPKSPPFTEAALKEFVMRGFLIKRDALNVHATYRLEPILDVLRPSVAKSLRVER